MIMMTSSKQQLQYFNPITPLSMSNFTDSLTERLQQIHTASRPIILVCIGSDRATGDSLYYLWDTSCCIRSPLTGDNLLQTNAIAKPVFHAKRTVPSYCPEIFTLSLELADDILCISKKYYVYGSLHSPVHAVNLKATLQDIYRSFDDPYIIAIDAALGAKEHIGTVTLGDGALFPGIGVSKQLPRCRRHPYHRDRKYHQLSKP